MVIRFFSKIEEWKDFSNLAPYLIELESDIWSSVEHYYQYKRFEKIDREYAQKIKYASTPKKAKILSMQNDKNPHNWSDIKVDLLKTAVRKKFESYSNLENLLISTGDEELIEANPDDCFWGEGKDGSGENMMGKILMELRTYLRNKKE